VKLADFASFPVLAIRECDCRRYRLLSRAVPSQEPSRRACSARSILNPVVLTFLAVIGFQEVYTRFGANAATLINSLRSGRLSRLDVATLEEGYYENLNRVERFNSQLWELYKKRPSDWLDGMVDRDRSGLLEIFCKGIGALII
jgi:hypothetical protein